MLVFDDVIFSLQSHGGISRFWREVTGGFDHNGRLGVGSMPVVRTVSPFNLSISNVQAKLFRYINYNRTFMNRPHIFHSSYSRVNCHKDAVNIVTFHDFIYEKFSDDGIGKRLHIWQKKRALGRADCIVCISENTKKDLLELYPESKSKRIEIIGNGVSDRFCENDTPHIKKAPCAQVQGKFFLYVGHRGKCKNFEAVLTACQILGSDFSCIVVGTEFSAEEKRLIDAAGLGQKIINVGRVSDQELLHLYSIAYFFFFPSFYEGFGIPPLEAMKTGCPVVCSNSSSLPEVVENAAILFDPYDKRSMSQALKKITSEIARDKLIERGKRVSYKKTWSSVRKNYAELYYEMLADKNSDIRCSDFNV